ncbi:hypothetical protein GCM10027162_24740 [Streptomyces incanus]
MGRARRLGGGCKRVVDLDPALRSALLALVEPEMRGDSMSPPRWTTKSTRSLAGGLTRQGHRISADTVGDLLREAGFSLQGNAKTIEGRQRPDRDGQFGYINEHAEAHQASDDPVISVDMKKKEFISPYKNTGRLWRPHGDPEQVSPMTSLTRRSARSVPYGIYDLAAHTDWVTVSSSFALPVKKRLSDGIYPSELHRESRRDRVTVRVIEYSVSGDDNVREVFCLIITLVDPETAPALELARNYAERWPVEVLFKLVKVDMRTSGGVLCSGEPEGVHQELWALLCVYQALRTLITKAAVTAGVDPSRISFPPVLDAVKSSVRTAFPPECLAKALYFLTRTIVLHKLIPDPA